MLLAFNQPSAQEVLTNMPVGSFETLDRLLGFVGRDAAGFPDVSHQRNPPATIRVEVGVDEPAQLDFCRAPDLHPVFFNHFPIHTKQSH